MKLLLTTTGRKTGRPHEVPLYAFDDGNRLVIVGSLGGAAKDPDWVWNLRTDPRAKVRRGRKVHEVRSYEAKGKERVRLWQLVSAEFPLYETYRRLDRRLGGSSDSGRIGCHCRRG